MTSEKCIITIEWDYNPSHIMFFFLTFSGTSEWYKIAGDSLDQQLKVKFNTNKAKNVILFIGDGMGMATITSSRIYKGQQMNKTGEETVLKFEEFPHVALSKVKTRLYCSHSDGRFGTIRLV